jgi:3-oxoacyl-[acyl-carrier-protein] synthase I
VRQRPVHIVGVAAHTAVGLAAESTAAAIRAGISRVAGHPFLIAADGEHVGCGRVPLLDPRLTGAERFLELARPLFAELAHKLPQVTSLTLDIPLLLALPEARPGFTAAEAVQVAETLGGVAAFGAPRLGIRRAGDGHAGALRGLATAVDLIAGGQEDLCMVVGVDSYLHGETIDWLDADLRLAREDVRGGFPPGEGAVVLLLANENARRRLALPSLAMVRSVAFAMETRPEDAPEGPLGEALAVVYERVLRELQRPQERVDDVYCDINDERGRTSDYGFALLRLGEVFRSGTDYISPVAQVGELGAATPLLNCLLAARAWARGYASGPLALVSGSSWGGLRGAALLQEGTN